MRWELTDEQADFRSVLADWLGDRCGLDALRTCLDAGDTGVFEDAFVAEGWSAVGSPEDLGGQGGGLVELAIAAEELGRRAAPCSAWLASMLAVPALVGDLGAARALLAGGVTTVLACPADVVPGTFSVDEDGGLLTGRIATVLGAGRAARLVVPTDGPDGPTLVLVEADQPGVTVQVRALTDRTRSVADVVLDGARGTVLPIDAGPALEAAALRGAVLVAADSLGALARMLDLTVEYAGQRRQFGVPIGSFQAVKHAAAEMLVALEAARSIVYLAAASLDVDDPDAAQHAAAAKAQVTGRTADEADTALTLHGAIGYTWEHELQLFYKRAKLNASLFGSPAAWNERLAEALDLLPAGTA